MPLQNRVDPFGTIIRTAARGTIMGNRGGAIHNAAREIVRPYLTRRWIACVLEFKGRHREVMTPGRYTELFFLDEAVALAAGHRPCSECRREHFNAFRDAWKPGGPRPKADEMDVVLHPTRIDAQRRKVTYRARLGSLPDGTFVQIEAGAWVIWQGALRLWTPIGYTRREPLAPAQTVDVLTPRPIVACLAQGYGVAVHSL
jgi:hypothetical protein